MPNKDGRSSSIIYPVELKQEAVQMLNDGSDVVLDLIHFSEGNSSIEALAMGVPLVTIEGSFLRSRITSAMYRQIGLTDLIAKDREDYWRLAARLASEPEFRQSITRRILDCADAFFEDRNAAREFEECMNHCGLQR